MIVLYQKKDDGVEPVRIDPTGFDIKHFPNLYYSVEEAEKDITIGQLLESDQEKNKEAEKGIAIEPAKEPVCRECVSLKMSEDKTESFCQHEKGRKLFTRIMTGKFKNCKFFEKA